MYIYTHLVVASQVEPVLKPPDRQAYYLGAVVPDFRYMAGLPRSRTHLPLAEIAAWFARYPDLHSFILGYLVHCALDELHARSILVRKPPLAYARPLIRLKMAHTLLETHYIENTILMISLPEHGNPILEGLGIGEPLVQKFSGWVNHFLQAPSFESELAFLNEALEAVGNPRFRRLMGPLLAFQRNQRLKNWLLGSLDPPYFEAAVTRYLLSQEGVGRYLS